jgi:myo-inositol 2-dehydrogenase/D-chiro-inositol 1-dehydrogenase
MSKKLRFGIVGAGRIGPVHAETLAYRAPQAETVVIADINRAAAEKVAVRYNIPKVADSAEDVINDPGIDAIVLCTPTNTHTELIVQAAQAGKHIFCEKPVSHSLRKIDEAIAAVEAAGVKMQVGFNRRFDSNFMRVRHAVDSGEIGTPQIFHIVSRDPFPPPLSYLRPSGGIFRDMMIHDFDMARFLMGDVEEVFASGAVLIDPGFAAEDDFDTALAMLKFKSGAIGTIDNSRKSTFGYDQRVEILGSKGKIESGNRYANEVQVSGEKCVYSDLPYNFFMQRYPESFALELQMYVEAVLEDKPVPVTGADSRAPIAMALAARKSVDERRPVRLAEVEE